jgi:hypothetical protein
MSIYAASAAAITCANPGMTSRIVLADVMDAPIARKLALHRMSLTIKETVAKQPSPS